MVPFSSGRSPLTAVFCVSSPPKEKDAGRRKGEAEAQGPQHSIHFGSDWACCHCLVGGLLGWKVSSCPPLATFLQIGVASGKTNLLWGFPARYQGGHGLAMQLAGPGQQGFYHFYSILYQFYHLRGKRQTGMRPRVTNSCFLFLLMVTE